MSLQTYRSPPEAPATSGLFCLAQMICPGKSLHSTATAYEPSSRAHAAETAAKKSPP